MVIQIKNPVHNNRNNVNDDNNECIHFLFCRSNSQWTNLKQGDFYKTVCKMKQNHDWANLRPAICIYLIWQIAKWYTIAVLQSISKYL